MDLNQENNHLYFTLQWLTGYDRQVYTHAWTRTHVGVICTIWHKLITISQTRSLLTCSYWLSAVNILYCTACVCFCPSAGLLQWQVHILIVLLVLAAHHIKGFKGTKGKLAGRGRSSSSAGDSGPNLNTLPSLWNVFIQKIRTLWVEHHQNTNIESLTQHPLTCSICLVTHRRVIFQFRKHNSHAWAAAEAGMLSLSELNLDEQNNPIARIKASNIFV